MTGREDDSMERSRSADITGINHVTLAISDLERSFAFYVEIVGLRPVARWLRGAYLVAGEDWICLSLDRQARTEPVADYTHLAFSIPAAKFIARCALIRAHGAPIWKDNLSEGDSLYFLDPDGHKLELHVGGLGNRLAALRERPYDGLILY